MNPQTVAFIGRSGSGKDTQVELLSKVLIPNVQINTGDLLRTLAKTDSPAGEKVRKVLEEGNLAPEWLASFLWMREIIERIPGNCHIIIGGSPRKAAEAVLLDEVTEFVGRSKPVAVYLDVSEKEATARLLARGRKDDNRSAIENRLRFFKEHVLPVIDYYRDRGRLIEVGGESNPQAVHLQIRSALLNPD